MQITAEATSRYAEADGVRVHYHEAGEGPAVLLIHGGAPGATGWGNFGQNMEALSQHFRTLIVDLPGYGSSGQPKSEGGRFSAYAAVFEAFLAHLDISKCHVIGLATGGAVAMMVALRKPELIDRLILVSSAGGIQMFQPSPSEGMKLIMGYYGGEGPGPEKMRHYLETIIYDRTRVTDELVEERYQASIDPEFMAKAPEGRGEPAPGTIEPLWQRIHEISAKTLIIWGRDNRVMGYDNALFMLNRLPNAELHVYAQTGLWVPWEKCEDFNREVIGFLNA